MKRVIIALAGIALIASANVASAKTQPKASHRGDVIQRNVALPSQSGYHANGDLRYGPQIDYPQSPPGGGY